MRYKCLRCTDFMLCMRCQDNSHLHHDLVRVKVPHVANTGRPLDLPNTRMVIRQANVIGNDGAEGHQRHNLSDCLDVDGSDDD